ncbi:MAG: nitroreductase family protein [Coriobacteriia bacterium]|nr:nitroreductase family protein [Coriobacteriia bacterium]
MPPFTESETERWNAAIAVRRSRREFDSRPVPEADLDAIGAVCARFTPYPDARVALVRHAPAGLFRGLVGSYGRVHGATSALVFISRAESVTGSEHCGYIGQTAVLEATARSLATCWIAGTFRSGVAADLVTLADGEVIRGVSPIGFAVADPPGRERLVFGAGKPKRRRERDAIAPGAEAWPSWALAGVEAARIAPSAMNRQPWRFRRSDDGSVVVSAAGVDTPRTALRLDCGIAMLHFEIAVRAQGADGAWETLDAPDVARWVPAQ